MGLHALGQGTEEKHWRSYEVYRPRIERHYVVNARTHALKYNHDSSIAWFGDQWFCLWNANTIAREGAPGQLNYFSTSRDGKTWTAPEPAFASDKHSENPVPCPQGTQWQPNLIIVEGELWAVWCQYSSDEHHGTYVSRLREPDGRWVNRLLTWDGLGDPVLNGKSYRIFPTQNPYRLRSGRVLAPVTLQSPGSTDAPANVTGWLAWEKIDSVLYSDDLGKTWHLSPGAIQPGRSWAQWEPTVWEQSDGSVMMFARNLDVRSLADGGPASSQMLTWSVSHDGGTTWTAHAYVPLETTSSRMHVVRADAERWILIHNDYRGDTFQEGRQNLALFFKRGDGLDFVAGPGFTEPGARVFYPQGWVHDGELLVSYTHGHSWHDMSIRVAHISPLPDVERYYLLPRANVPDSRPRFLRFLFPRTNQPAPPAPRLEEGGWAFDGGQQVVTRSALETGSEGFSCGAWIRPSTGSGTILDSRPETSRGGFVWGIAQRAPYLYLEPKRGNFGPRELAIPPSEWCYVGMTLDNRTGRAVFYVNGQSETVSFEAPAPQPLSSGPASIGAPRPKGSSAAGFVGSIRSVAFYPSVLLEPEEHIWLAGVLANGRNASISAGARVPDTDPSLWLDVRDSGGFAAAFEMPSTDFGSVEESTVDGRQVLHFHGEASAGVELDENHRDRGDTVVFEFAFQLDGGSEHVICTVGDAVEPARLVSKDGCLFLRCGKQEIPCGRPSPGGWTHVALRTQGPTTSVSVDGGEEAEVRHHPQATWIYLGQGYRASNQSTDAKLSSKSRFSVDVTSVRTRVPSGEGAQRDR